MGSVLYHTSFGPYRRGEWVGKITGAFSIYQKLSKTSMERSIEWRSCSFWHKFHSFMFSSPKFKMAQRSSWIAWNWWFLLQTPTSSPGLFPRSHPFFEGKALGTRLVQTHKWNMLGKFPTGKQDYLFKIALILGNFPVESLENVCSINMPTRISRISW